MRQLFNKIAAIADGIENLSFYYSLLLTKTKVEEVLCGPEMALNTCKKMMKLWRQLHELNQEV